MVVLVLTDLFSLLREMVVGLRALHLEDLLANQGIIPRRMNLVGEKNGV